MDKEVYIKEYVSRINKVLDFIEHNLITELNLETLASTANFSKFHFHRIFKNLIGETLNKYINRVRLERAANMLQLHKEKTITDIAYECGFTNNAVFAKTFKNRFKISASEWRKNKKNEKSKNGQAKSKNDKLDISNSPYFRNIFNNQKNIVMKNLKGIKVVELQEMTVAYVRHIGAYKGDGNLFEGLINKIMSWAGPRGLIQFPQTKMLNVYHDNPKITEQDKLRTSICITVPKDTKVEGEIGKMNIPGGKYMLASFEITSDEFEESWDYTYKKLMEDGFQPSDSVAFEIGKNDPSKHPENKHIIDICVPVKPLK